MRPTCLDELAQIKGVGASKLERYGRRVLGVLSAEVPAGVGEAGLRTTLLSHGGCSKNRHAELIQLF